MGLLLAQLTKQNFPQLVFIAETSLGKTQLTLSKVIVYLIEIGRAKVLVFLFMFMKISVRLKWWTLQLKLSWLGVELEWGMIRYQRDVSKQDQKLIFSYVQSNQSVKEQIKAVIDNNNLIISDRKGISEVLNLQFASVFVNEPESCAEELPRFDRRTSSILTVKQTLENLTNQNIEKCLLNINTNKTCGTAEISSLVLKKCAKELAQPLGLIFRKYVSEGRVTNKWKEGNITPIFKKGSRLVVENYRPMSLTSIVCKILKRLIRNTFVDFLIEN